MTKAILASVLVAVSFVFASSEVSGLRVDPLVQCIGAPAGEPNGGLYPEPRYFIDFQAQFQPQPQSPFPHELGHLHAGACVPAPGSTIRGDFQLRIRFVMFQAVGAFTSFHVNDQSNAVIRFPRLKFNPPRLCGPDQPQPCTWWDAYTIPTAGRDRAGQLYYPMDRWVLFNFFADIQQPDGMLFFVNSKLPYFVDNGRADASGSGKPFMGGVGWIGPPKIGGIDSDHGYRNALLDTISFPTAPLSGLWRPRVRFTASGSSENTSNRCGFVSIDPDMHAHPPRMGTIIWGNPDGSCQLSSNTVETLTIDTSMLAPGLHKLFIAHLDEPNAADPTGTSWGVVAIPFVVR